MRVIFRFDYTLFDAKGITFYGIEHFQLPMRQYLPVELMTHLVFTERQDQVFLPRESLELFVDYFTARFPKVKPTLLMIWQKLADYLTEEFTRGGYDNQWWSDDIGVNVRVKPSELNTFYLYFTELYQELVGTDPQRYIHVPANGLRIDGGLEKLYEALYLREVVNPTITRLVGSNIEVFPVEIPTVIAGLIGGYVS